MSATAAHAATKLPRPPPVPEPLKLRIVEATFSIGVAVVLIVGLVSDPTDLPHEAPVLLAWLLTIVVADLMPVPLWGNLVLSLSLPVLLAAGMTFSPLIAGGLAFVGSNDPREFRREVSALHGLYNRSQIAASTLVASIVFHITGGSLDVWPHVLGISLMAVGADMVVNYSLVVLARRLFRPQPVMQILRDFYGGEPAGFLVTYVAFGLVALLLAAVYSVGGTWGTLAFALPLFLARQVFLYSRRARDMAEMIAEKTRVLLAVSERIAEERRDERLTIAAGIHDEVLPPLYKVHLMGQVIRRDLDNGQLLALEDDIPDLLRAADSANDAMRLLIRDLRHSPLGPGGLEETLRLLVSHLQHDAAPRIHLELSAIAGSPVVQLLAYQVAREAIKNAIRHASAANIWIRVGVQDTDLRVVVEDDGVGFDPPEVDRDNHFGLQIMRERVELAGGVFLVVSRPAAGCQVVARFPSEMSR